MPRIRRTAEAVDDRDDRGAEATASLEEAREPRAGQSPPERTEVVGHAEHYAGHLRETTSSLFHYAAMAPAFKVIDSKAFKLYRDRLLADCGHPRDPIEIMIIEQLSLAHFSMGLLSCKAANNRQPEAVGVYSGAAARLMGEFRRSALALQAYRAAARQLAHDPAKDIVISPNVEVDPIGDEPGKECTDGKLIANSEVPDAGETIIRYPGPAPLGDQPPQSPEVGRHDPRRKSKGPRRGAAAPAVGAVHGAANA
jgi:hypothetical protein